MRNILFIAVLILAGCYTTEGLARKSIKQEQAPKFISAYDLSEIKQAYIVDDHFVVARHGPHGPHDAVYGDIHLRMLMATSDGMEVFGTLETLPIDKDLPTDIYNSYYDFRIYLSHYGGVPFVLDNLRREQEENGL